MIRPDDLHIGQFVMIRDADWIPAGFAYVNAYSPIHGYPLQVLAVQLPFIAVALPCNTRTVIDTRLVDLARCDLAYVEALFPTQERGGK